MATDHIHTFATVTSKGQVTIPKAVRDVLEIETGDRISFVLVDGGAVVGKAPDLLELAGVVPTPEDVAGLTFDEIRRAAWEAKRRA